jgi:hypothetical protein
MTDDDFMVEEEYNYYTGSSSKPTTTTLYLRENLKKIYGLKSITRTQEGFKKIYTIKWKNTKFDWQPNTEQYGYTTLEDLEQDFNGNGRERSIDNVLLDVIWEHLENDLMSDYPLEFDPEFSDKNMEKFMIENPEYSNGNAVKIARQEIFNKNTEGTSIEIFNPKPEVLLRISDILKGESGYGIGVVEDIFGKFQYLKGAFQFCRRCFYVDSVCDFTTPINAKDIHQYIPDLERCIQCKRTGTLSIEPKYTARFDFILTDHINPDIKIKVVDCDELEIKKDQRVIIDADEEMIETSKGIVKILRCKQIKIIPEDEWKFIVGRSKKQKALPEPTKLEDRIRNLVRDVYKSYNGEIVELIPVLQQVLDKNPDVRDSKIFKSKDSSNSKSIRNLAEKLVEQRPGDEGKIERVGDRPYKFMWQDGDRKSLSNQKSLPNINI